MSPISSISEQHKFCRVFLTMNPIPSTSFWDDEARSIRNEDYNTCSVLRSRTEEEKQRRRREWQRQQQRERQYEKLKQQKILEYERKREQALKYAEEKPSCHSQSKSSSESPSHFWYRNRSVSTASESGSLHEKLDVSIRGTEPLFRGPETQINSIELRRIKVDIYRNIITWNIKEPATELERDILNPEDVIVKRREGEGCKPLFDREEIKKAALQTNEVEEQRTDIAIDNEQLSSTFKSHTLRELSLSVSPIRNPIYSSGYPPFYESRHCIDLKHQENKTENYDIRKNNGSNLEKHREYKEKYTERDANKHGNNRLRSRELHNSYSRLFIEEKSCRDRYRERSNERSHEKRDRDRERERNRERERERERDRDRDRNKDRDRSRERRDLAPHYIESPIPVPIYYGSFPPRPIVVSPMVPIRGHIPPMGRGRY